MTFRLLELCAGYGSQALALKNLGLDVYSEIAEFDKYASQAYMQLHGDTKNYGDIYTIDETKLPYFDMITYSTPCQDFSVAGKGKGGDKGSGTRSSLLWECERIIRAVKPKYLLMENVKNLLSDKHRHNFNEWFKVLEDMGYTNYYKVLNAKDYGIPQNRERIFCVSILGGGQYLFPNPIPLKKRLKDMLEDNVDEKYYLSDKIIKFYIENTIKQKEKGNGFSFQPNDGNGIAKAITTRAGGRMDDNFIIEPKVIQLGNIVNTGNWDNPQRGRIYSPEGISPALNTCQGGGLEPKILEEKYKNDRNKTIRTLLRREFTSSLQKLSFETAPKKEKLYYMWKTDESVGILRETLSEIQKIWRPSNIKSQESYRIRKLTAKECFRLMGVKDEQYNRLHDLSNSQLYKLAGNSIVVDVLEHIFRNLLMPETTNTKGQLTLL